MKKQKLDTISRTVYIPRELKEVIDSIKTEQGKSISKIKKNYSYNLIGIIERKSRNEHKVATGYIPLSTSYLKLLFTTRYTELIKPLKDYGVIESDEKYYYNRDDVERSKCLFYRLNPKFFQSEERYVPVKYTFELLITNEDDKSINIYHEDHKELLKTLQLDYDGLTKLANELIDKCSDLKKRQELQVAWLGSIENLKEGGWYARRNKSNLRLDSNWTNMPGELRAKINEDNDYIEIDLTASQYCVLSLLMQRDGIVDADALKFYSLTESGQLYEYLSTELEIDREKVKGMMFFVSFSKLHHKGKLKDRFAMLFPSVLAWINDKKEQHGHVEVSKLLQTYESTIFIDGIKTELMGAEIPHYTVHDSVNVPREHLDETLYFMEYHMKEAGLKGVLKVDGKRKGEHIGSPYSN